MATATSLIPQVKTTTAVHHGHVPGRDAWTPRPASRLRRRPRTHRLFGFHHLPANTGVQRGELLNLRWEHLDLDSSEDRITGSAAVIGGQRIEGTTKGGRVAPCHPRGHLTSPDECADPFITARQPAVSEPQALPTAKHAGPPDRYSDGFRRLLKRADLHRMTLHDSKPATFT
jgi:integrase